MALAPAPLLPPPSPTDHMWHAKDYFVLRPDYHRHTTHAISQSVKDVLGVGMVRLVVGRVNRAQRHHHVVGTEGIKGEFDR